MRTIVEYHICGAGNVGDLVDKVQSLINTSGWQPYGPLLETGGYLLQAVVKYGPTPEEAEAKYHEANRVHG